MLIFGYISAFSQFEYTIQQTSTGNILLNGIGQSFCPGILSSGTNNFGSIDTAYLVYFETVYDIAASGKAAKAYIFSIPPANKGELKNLSGGVLIDSSYSRSLVDFPYDRYYFDSIPLHKDSTYYILFKEDYPLEAAGNLYSGGNGMFLTSTPDSSIHSATSSDIRFRIKLFRPYHQGTDITQYSIFEEADTAEIDPVNKIINIYIYEGADLTSIKPDIVISEGATINPGLNMPVDFSNDTVVYLLESEDPAKIASWRVILKEVVNAPWPVFTQKYSSIIDPPANLISVSWGDLNNDHFPDMLMGFTNSLSRLYINKLDGNFEEIEIEAFQTGNDTRGTAIFDFNNDSLNDILILNVYQNNKLLINQGSNIFDTLPSSELTQLISSCLDCSVTDMDNDGLLDIFVTRTGASNILYRNYGNGNFQSIASGDLSTATANSYDAAWADYDNNGRQDVFVATTNNAYDYLYKNNGNGNFQQITSTPIDDYRATTNLGIWGDFDNDMDLDLYVLAYKDNYLNILYENDGSGNFTARTDLPFTGIYNSSYASWIDIDNNGYLDLALDQYTEGSYFFLNFGNSEFIRVTTGKQLNKYYKYWTDYDNDGDMDAYCRRNDAGDKNFLIMNPGNNYHWLSIECNGTVSNTNAIGTKLKINATINGVDLWQFWEISGSGTYLSSSDYKHIFGLGDAIIVDSLIIDWPSGTNDVFTNLPVDSLMIITENAAGSTIEYWHPLNNQTEIYSYTFDNEYKPAIIDSVYRTIDVFKDINSSFDAIIPTISISDLASISPVSGSPVNFSNDTVIYIVTAENGISVSEWKVIMHRVTLSSEAEILSFSFDNEFQPVLINSTTRTIDAYMKANQDFSKLVPRITISDSASVTPKSMDTVDFSNDTVNFLVIAEDGITAKRWKVIMHRIPLSSQAEITSFSFDREYQAADIISDIKTINVYMEMNNNFDTIVPSITISDFATISPASGDAVDFSNDTVIYTVTAEDTTTINWTAIMHRIDTTTSIKNDPFENISVFPNPVNDYLTISGVRGTIQYIKIIDISGIQIKYFTVSETNAHVYIGDLNAGIYMMQIISDHIVYSKLILKN